MLGAIGIFVYVGAEVSIGSFIVSFFAEPSIAGLAESETAKIYCILLGRRDDWTIYWCCCYAEG